MKTFDVQSIGIEVPFRQAFDYIADPKHLPEWARAFKSVSNGRALLSTPAGSMDISLDVHASRDHGTIDWTMTFPDGSVARALSRVVKADARRSIFSFVLLPPPVPLEQLEGALEQQAAILKEELSNLKATLERG